VSFATINNLGQVAGYYSLPTTTRAWIWDAVNGVQYLDDLLPAGWNMETVLDINDMGQILGYGNFGGGSNQELLLTPSVPEPSTWVLMVCGLFGLIIFRRRATSSPE
jgi:hypothetical protein